MSEPAPYPEGIGRRDAPGPPPWSIGVLRLAVRAAEAVLALFGLVLLVPPAQTVFAVSARTETLTVRVTNKEAAAFGLRQAIYLPADGDPVCLSDISVVPGEGALVQYVRFGHDKAEILVTDGTVLLQPAHSGVGDPAPPWAGRVAPPVQFVLDPTGNANRVCDCKAENVVRLPVFGGIEQLGAEAQYVPAAGGPRLALLSGSVQMFVRAADWFHRGNAVRYPFDLVIGGFVSLFEAVDPGELFAVERTPLPAGSTMSGATSRDGEAVDWWGFADIDFVNTYDRGFTVEASAQAQDVELRLPASTPEGGGARDRQTLSLTLVERFSNDPGLRLIAILVAITVAAIDVAEKLFRRGTAE